jgi:anti-anti-sigma factor
MSENERRHQNSCNRRLKTNPGSASIPRNFSIFPSTLLWPPTCSIKLRESGLKSQLHPGGFPMTNPVSSQSEPTARVSADLAALIRGEEQTLVARIAPLLQNQNITLDLGSVSRIDAAGIAALLTLYANAHRAGHSFTITNPSPRVAKILTLVGLEGILAYHIANGKSHCGPISQMQAA